VAEILQNSHIDERIEISGEKVRNGVVISATKIVLIMSIKASGRPQAIKIQAQHFSRSKCNQDFA